MDDKWKKAQKWEREWWGDCLNTYGEEEKQIVYAIKMGLKWFHNGKSPYNIDLGDKSVLDIGGCASSLLLKCLNRGIVCTVADPLPIPKWAVERYETAGIVFSQTRGEDTLFAFTSKEYDVLPPVFDEVWIYNVLQHTDDPALICKNARKLGKIVRIFEWVGIKDEHGHPHELTEKKLNEWLGGQGKTEILNHNTLQGKCYYGIFKGDFYEEI